MATPSSTHHFLPGYQQENRSHLLTRTAIAFTILCPIATAFRWWARKIQNTPRQYADILILFSLCFNLAVCTCAFLSVRYGTGRHVATLSPSDLVSYPKVNYLAIPAFYVAAVTFPKLAVLDLYLQIFNRKIPRRICYLCGSVMCLQLLALSGVLFAQCQPLAKLWTPGMKGNCIDMRAMYTWSGLTNVVTDVIMIILPIPTVIQIQQRWYVKVGILCSFLIGGLGIITSIIRIVGFSHVWYGPFDPDYTFNIAAPLAWTIAEPGVYHIAACLITYRSIFRWLFFETPLYSSMAKLAFFSGNNSKSSGYGSRRNFGHSAHDSRVSEHKMTRSSSTMSQPIADEHTPHERPFDGHLTSKGTITVTTSYSVERDRSISTSPEQSIGDIPSTSKLTTHPRLK